MRNKIIIVLLFTLFNVTHSLAQIDTAFWFAAPWVTPDHAARHPIKVHIATFAAPTTTVRLRQPAMPTSFHKYDTTIVIPANSVFDYTFWKDAPATTGNRGWDSLEVRPADQVVPYGLYFSSTSNVSIAYDVITTGNNPETMSLKGQNGLGTEFVVPHQTRWFNQFKVDFGSTPPGVNQPKQQINIVGTKPNTVVWITPKCAIVGHPANVTYSIMLVNPGDAYTLENSVQNTNVPGNNLSGTLLSSNKPIAVTTADDSVRNPSGGCHDLIGDQIVPVEIVGKDYIMNKGAMNAGALEGGYIVGTENFTSVQLTNALSVVTNTIINKGDTYFYNVTTSLTYVQADKNVYCYQADGIGCESGAAILPPLSCAGSSLVAFSRNQANLFFLNILCKNGAQGSFTINGSTALITAGQFTVVPGTGGQYVAAQIPFTIGQIPIGSYTVGNNTPFPLNDFALGIFDGSVGGGMNFYYMSSFLRRVEISSNTVTPVCATPNATVMLSGNISGGAITGVWTPTNNGPAPTGTINPVYTSTLNNVSTVYTLSPADLALDTLRFILTSIGSCTSKSVTLKIRVNQPPTVSGSVSPTPQCKNNLLPLTLTGSQTNALSSVWSGGNGGSFGPPGPNTTYTPSLSDLAANGVTLVLTTTGASVGCVNTAVQYTVGFVDPPSVSVITSTIACTNSQSVGITGTVVGSNVTYSWSTSGQGFFSPSNLSLTTGYTFLGNDLAQPSLTLFLTAIDNTSLCAPVSDQIVVNIQPEPSLTLATTPTVCASAGVIALNGTVTGGGAGAITWTTVNGSGAFTPIPPTNANYLISQNDTLGGVNTLTFSGTSSGGFCPSVTNTIEVTIIKIPFLTVNANTSVCQYAPVFLNGSVSGYTNAGFWNASLVGAITFDPQNPNNGGFSPNNGALGGIFYPSLANIAAGSVTITLVSAPVFGISCPSATKSFIVTFVPSPQADFSFTTKRCVGDPVGFNNISNLNGTNMTSANWDFGNGFNSIGTGSVITTYTSPGIYNVTFTVVGTNSLNISCFDTIAKNISVNPLPLPDFTMNNTCQDVVAIITNQSLPANGQFTWFFGPSATPSISTMQTPNNVSFHLNGPISVDLKEVIAATQCSASVTKVVQVNAQPNAEFGMTNNPTVAQEPVYYSDFSTPTGSIVTWLWNFGDETSDTGRAVTHNYQNGGVYFVTLTVVDDQGCYDTTIKQIEVNLIPQVPTGFTPNGDGHNDRLYVKGGPFNKMNFRVYNNWGELIYESTDQLEGWDGKKNGKDQPVGVYVWTLEVDLYNNRTVRKNGDVTLMR